jgi:hypothetical protein
VDGLLELLEVWKLLQSNAHCVIEFQTLHPIVLAVAEDVVVPVISNSVFHTGVEIAPLQGSCAFFRVKSYCVRKACESQHLRDGESV